MITYNSISTSLVIVVFLFLPGPTTTTAEPTKTSSTSTTASITTAATSTYVQTTSPTTATLTSAATTTATLTTSGPTTAVPTTSTPTTAVPTTSTFTMDVPITATPTIDVPITATPTVTALTPTTAPSSSYTNQPKNNNINEEGYIIGGCIGGAVVVVLLIIGIMLCLRRWAVCKCWRSKMFSETSMDPNAKHNPAKHIGHGGNSQTRKQYDWPQKLRTPDQSFHYHFNNPSYVVPAGKRKYSSRYLDYSSNPPSYTFHDPFSGEYIRTADQSRGHHVGQRYAPYPQSQQRGRMQQGWYHPYISGRPGFYDYSGNWDIYY